MATTAGDEPTVMHALRRNANPNLQFEISPNVFLSPLTDAAFYHHISPNIAVALLRHGARPILGGRGYYPERYGLIARKAKVMQAEQQQPYDKEHKPLSHIKENIYDTYRKFSQSSSFPVSQGDSAIEDFEYTRERRAGIIRPISESAHDKSTLTFFKEKSINTDKDKAEALISFLKKQGK